MQKWLVYCLINQDCTKSYIGTTTDIERRLRQHNGEIKGGAKATRSTKSKWAVFITVGDFDTQSESCQFEYNWKHAKISKKEFSTIKEKKCKTLEKLEIKESLKIKKYFD